MPTYLGWTVITMPSTPWPKSIEVADDYISSANTNPFTAQQQVYDWGARHKEISVSYAALTHTQGVALSAFLESLNGMANVFQFPSALCAQYPDELTSDGTTPRYWRLKTNRSNWGIKIGSVYSITFEAREAL